MSYWKILVGEHSEFQTEMTAVAQGYAAGALDAGANEVRIMRKEDADGD